MANANNIKKHVVTKGDLAMVAGGQPLFDCPVPGGKVYYKVVPGQLVAYTEEVGSIPQTVDAAGLSAVDSSKLNIGVGIDTTGDGAADQIRLIGSDHISGCNLDNLSVSPPQCGVPEVVDFFYDCTQCNETYSLKVSYDDNMTRSYSKAFKSAAEVVGSMVTECHSCDDCAPEHNCKEVACGLVDALNNDRDLKIRDKAYPDWKQGRGVKPPFRAVRLHERTVVYCITPTAAATDCEDCNTIPAITEATVNGTTVTLTNNLNPADNTTTLVSQLEAIAAQIERAFEDEIGPHSGSAFVTKGTGNCCEIQLHVNTCDATFAIGDGVTPLVACTDENPFQTYTKDPNCVDCTPAPETYTLSCGIRIISDPVEMPCDCYMNQPQSFWGRIITVEPIGDGWSLGKTKVDKVQKMELPAGMGSMIQWLEYQQMPGGKGRNYRGSSPRQGWFSLPEGRIKEAPTADCKKTYCSYFLNSHLGTTSVTNEYRRNNILSGVHIPQPDTTTKTDWEAFLTALIAVSPNCSPLGAVTCP